MIITILFLISCVMTARLLEKKKMQVASIAYTVLFVILFTALLFTTDIELISRALSKMMGARAYLLTKDALLYVFHSAGYGVCIFIAFSLTFFLQISLSLIYAVVAIVKFFKKGVTALFSKKDNYKRPYTPRALCLHNDYNRLYCRMLN